MKLRTRLVLSYLIVVIVFAVGMLLLVEIVGRRITEHDLASADRSVDAVAQANLRLSENVLGRYGEEFVFLQGQLVASRLSAMLRGRNLTEYAALRRDEALRATATPDMLTYDGTRAGYCDLIDSRGVSVLHPNREVEGRNFRDWQGEYPKMWEMVRRAITAKDGSVVRGYYSFLDRDNRSKKKYMCILPVPDTPFFVCAVVNIDEYFTPVHAKIRAASASASRQGQRDILDRTEKSTAAMRYIVLAGSVVLVLIAGGFGAYLARTISRPILKLRDGVRRIGEGDFSISVGEGGIPEIDDLKKSVNRLGRQLTDYTTNLTREVQARQAVESELSVASRIQQSLLPHTFPPFPEHREFSLHAINRAAKQVGGDFYDFFFVSPDRLIVLIGDVSGKGVPASLFMAVTRTVLRIVCVHQPDVARALTETNRILCRDKDTDLFVTVFLACYDIRTGRVEYANGGHNPPFLLAPDGRCTPLAKPGGLILAIDPNEIYETNELTLSPGQTLVLYTDGVTEAMRPAQEPYGEQRFAALLQTLAGREMTDLCDAAVRDVMAFQQGRQFDDITLLAWRRET